MLAEKAGVELVAEDPKKKTERDRQYDVLEAATKYFYEYRPKKTAAEAYLKDRGVTGETIAKWRIGYAPGPPDHGWRELKNSLEAQKFTAQAAQDYMNPYLQAALNPQIEEARRQAQITRLGDANRLTQAGAYGGSRQAIMESELNRNLGQNLANITGQGYQTAYDKAMQQFNTEQSAAQQAQNLTNQYGLQALQNQANLGAQERAIQAEGIAADIAQFEEERDFPYKQTQYQQSLLQGLPLAAQSYSYAKPSQLSELLGGSGGLMGLLQSFGIIPSDAE